MIATREAVITAPQLSATILCRNMLLHDSPTKTILPEHVRCFQYQVYRMCAKQLKGFEIDDWYGMLEEFCCSDLVLQHNNLENDDHIGLHDFCVIGHQNLAKHVVLHMKSSLHPATPTRR
jgi:hypothetical protein